MVGALFAVMLAAAVDQPVGAGVSEALARERAEHIRNVRYELAFTIPEDRHTPVTGRVTARVTLDTAHRIVLDFEQPRDHIQSVRVHGRDIGVSVENGHLVIPATATTAGENEVEIRFVAGDDALNRNEDFLYTLHVPARARYTFPCFDQPDLKARYALTLLIPDGWQVVANGADTEQREMVRSAAGSWNDMVQFAETAPLPTYLFSFVAGRFTIDTATRNGRVFHMLHRETDSAKVARNRDAIFDLHAAALAWLEDYTGVTYPFGKFDFVMIPSFQFGGMEHPGALLYNASSMMLDESATQNQLLERASTIAHETSHMWFGDLVTMRWFNDVWMKEVFANFMAAKIVNPSFPQVNHQLRFLLSNYPQAYQVDRTAGANPIRQTLSNLTEAGQLYGPIIYQKAPVVMRQLELIVGEASFRDGLREYLRRYAFGNATWTDLIRILDARTPANLAAWSHAWVEERGRPSLAATLQLDGGAKIAALTITQRDPMRERNLLWPQRLIVTLGYQDGLRHLPVYMDRRQMTVPGAAGLPRPQFVLLNGGGLGYGLIVLDADSRRFLLDHVEEIPDALTRGSAWVTLWDNLLEGDIAPEAFFDAAVRAVTAESDEQNVQRMLGYVVRAFWRFLPPAQRASRSGSLEATLRGGLQRATTASQKSAWFSAFRDTALSADALAWLERVWRREEQVAGLPFAETDEITMAYELAVRDVPGADGILRTQLERTQNPDRKARFAFVMPALSADPAVRGQAFERFRDVENRRREPWVLDSLAYLNHPLREADANRFVMPALEWLRDIQRTGDIFFPTRWTESTLAGHRSAQAADDVRAFLAREKDYPERLRWVILTAADELFRASSVQSPTP